MTSQRFSIGTQVNYNSVLLEVVRYTPESGVVVMEEVDGGMTVNRPLNSLVDALFNGELEFVTTSRINRKKETSSIPNPEELKIDLSDYPARSIEIARFRVKAIAPFLVDGTPRTLNSYKERVAALQDEAKKLEIRFSYRSLYRWIADYEDGGGEIRRLIPNFIKRGGAGQSRLPQDAVNLIDMVIKSKLGKEVSTIHGITAVIAAKMEEENKFRPTNDQMSYPAMATVARRVETLDMKQRLEAKVGKRRAAQMIKQVGRTVYPELPLERVEFDHTKTDLIVIDEKDNLPLGRCTISFALDMATRYPLGYYLGFEPPSYYTVMECLYNSICPKPNVKELYGTEHDWIAYGVPNTFVTDQGKELIGKDLTDACESLGIVLDVAPVKTPEFKGGIERNFGTLNKGLFHTMPGTTFSNFLEKGDYNSEKEACVSLGELEKSLNIFIVDEYSERLHRGLGGIPARRWEYALQTNFYPRLPQDKETLRIMLGRVDYRVVQKYGVEFENIRYNCQDLAYLRLKMHGAKAKIKYHPGDMSRIYVFNQFEKTYVEVPALDQEYTADLSLWKHKVIKRYAQVYGDKEDLAALGRAKIKVQEIVDAAKSRSKLHSRSKISRFLQGGKPASLSEKKDAAQKALPAPQIIQVVKNQPKDDDGIIEIKTDVAGWEIASGISVNY